MGGRLAIEPPSETNNVSIILVSPKYDGNIGAVARTMLNFGIKDLRIVGRDGPFSDETRNRAKHAQDVLESCKIYENLNEAIEDCSIVIGTSGKRELGERISFRHFLLPEELSKNLSSVEGRVAFVFGPEDIGLTNEELHDCDLLVTIPTWEGYPILNLSHAVSIICYTWYVSISGLQSRESEQFRLLNPDLRERLRSEISRLSNSIPTKEHKRGGIEETLNRVIMRGLPKDDEIHRLLSVISEAADSFERDDSEKL
jgi:TrmH family RNA methyltransferase